MIFIQGMIIAEGLQDIAIVHLFTSRIRMFLELLKSCFCPLSSVSSHNNCYIVEKNSFKIWLVVSRAPCIQKRKCYLDDCIQNLYLINHSLIINFCLYSFFERWFFFFLTVLGFELRAMCLLSQRSTPALGLGFWTQGFVSSNPWIQAPVPPPKKR
jgi:hypothetical protein